MNTKKFNTAKVQGLHELVSFIEKLQEENPSVKWTARKYLGTHTVKWA